MWSNTSTSSSPTAASNNRLDQVGNQNEHQPRNEENIKHEDEVNCIKRRFGSPPVRYKHAVCAAQSSGLIYIHGGRFGNLPLDDDVWRFDPRRNSWLQLQTTGCRPPSLQEHTLLEFGGRLYLFGGQISAPSGGHSLWCLDLANSQWRSLGAKASARYGAYLGPTNRRGHSAVLYGNSMFVYGGFEDFRGSSGQLWEFDLLNERWELRNLSATSSCHPEPRHSHSAVVHEHSMYVYGGLSNLKPLADLWRWSWRERRWFRERTKGSSPGQLHGHSAVQAFGSMFVFGGERNGRPTRGLWRLNLANMSWRKIRPKGPRPSATTWHAAVANPLGILDAANYIIEGDPDRVLEEFDCCQVSAGHENGGQRQSAVLTHSKSSNAADSLAPRGGPKQHKSRLSFLRKSRRQSARPKSIYELKQIRASLSASDFNGRNNPSNNQNRLSVTLTKREPETCDPESSATPNQMDCDGDHASNNIGVLDSLDTDIKAMFRRALSPKREADDDTPMSVLEPSCRSQYVTAPAERADAFGSNMNTQRTSCAYTTPPSEMDTLRDEIVPSGHALLAPTPSGFDRRNNRPRSEIVQSLIDRADARIKHLYTPYFNSSQPHSSDRLSVRRREPRRGHSFLDKTKRHTIHQTMTYYSLYYSEESKSSSGDNQDASSSPKEDQEERADAGRLRDIDDFGSSSTMRGVELDARSSAVLVGVHQGQQVDRLSQNSSESRTLCQDPSRLSGEQQPASGSPENALTARPDTTSAASGDNTSLSFSVIAEFEEDDMLQFSFPAAGIGQTQRSPSPSPSSSPSRCPSESPRQPRVVAATSRVETSLVREPEDQLQTVILTDQHSGSAKLHQEADLSGLRAHNKSSSSGYDSLASRDHDQDPDTASREAAVDSHNPVGSIRTAESVSSSLLGGLSSATTIDTATSPEQSALRKLQARYGARAGLETSVLSSDSLAAIEALSGASSQHESGSPEKSLSQAESAQAAARRTQAKRTPLMSRSRFFGRSSAKSRYWQLCMFVIGGKQGQSSQTFNEPITVWRLYI